MPTQECLTVEFLRQCFDYIEDGRLFWKVRPKEHFSSIGMWKAWNTKWSGKEAGGVAWVSQRKDKEVERIPRHIIVLNGKHYFRSRLVYAFHTGEWPQKIDHENTRTLDDWIDNLRPATSSQNGHNRGILSNNTSGSISVCKNKYGKFTARITVNGDRKWLGSFKTLEEAEEKYREASIKYFGEFSPYYKKE